MYKPGKRFLFWVIYIPLSIIFIGYIFTLVFRIYDYYFSATDLSGTSPAYFFLGIYSSFGQFVERTAIAFAGLAVICFGLWLYEYYSAAKDKR